MKAILMMILGFGFIGNVAAACPQDMGYIAPVDVLPSCESTSILDEVQSQAQADRKVDAKVPGSTGERTRTATAETYVLCPQDIGYLAPPELLPPCGLAEAPALRADAAGVEEEALIARQAAISQPLPAIKKRGPKVQVAQEGAWRP